MQSDSAPGRTVKALVLLVSVLGVLTVAAACLAWITCKVNSRALPFVRVEIFEPSIRLTKDEGVTGVVFVQSGESRGAYGHHGWTRRESIVTEVAYLARWKGAEPPDFFEVCTLQGGDRFWPSLAFPILSDGPAGLLRVAIEKSGKGAQVTAWKRAVGSFVQVAKLEADVWLAVSRSGSGILVRKGGRILLCDSNLKPATTSDEAPVLSAVLGTAESFEKCRLSSDLRYAVLLIPVEGRIRLDVADLSTKARRRVDIVPDDGWSAGLLDCESVDGRLLACVHYLKDDSPEQRVCVVSTDGRVIAQVASSFAGRSGLGWPWDPEGSRVFSVSRNVLSVRGSQGSQVLDLELPKPPEPSR